MNPLNVTPPPTHTLHGFICFLSAWIGRLPHVCVWRVQRLPAGGLGRCEGQWLFGGGYSFSATPAAQHIAAKVRLPPPPSPQLHPHHFHKHSPSLCSNTSFSTHSRNDVWFKDANVKKTENPSHVFSEARKCHFQFKDPFTVFISNYSNNTFVFFECWF